MGFLTRKILNYLFKPKVNLRTTATKSETSIMLLLTYLLLKCLLRKKVFAPLPIHIGSPSHWRQRKLEASNIFSESEWMIEDNKCL